MSAGIISRRRGLVGIVGAAIAGSSLGRLANAQSVAPPAMPARLPVESRMPALDGATAWINTQPLTTEGLRGKVVLVDFCTYTCINWMRTLPYVRAWAAKYGGQGLVVLGVHTPEFGFEKDLANVTRALKAVRVDYPVAVDSDFAIWRAFDNAYWPALYFVDARGQVRHHWFGEGDYDRSERVIQQLLLEAGRGASTHEVVPIEGRGVEAPADWDNLKTPETYVDQGRTQNFASPGPALLDRPRVYARPAQLRLNQWALTGDWTMGKEGSVSNQANGRVACRFHARDLHLVMGPGARATPVRFRVAIDGQPPGAAHGLDIASNGEGQVVEPRLYQLVRQPPPIADRQFDIEFLDAGAQVFAFTFG